MGRVYSRVEWEGSKVECGVELGSGSEVGVACEVEWSVIGRALCVV